MKSLILLLSSLFVGLTVNAQAKTFECMDNEINQIYTINIEEEMDQVKVTLDTGAAPFLLENTSLDYDLDEDGDKTAYIISWDETLLSLGSGIEPAQTLVIDADGANGLTKYHEANMGYKKMICVRK